jgi:leucine dehydrogenase
MGLPVSAGGSGDPSPSTALGCFEGIRAAVAYKLGRSSLEGAHVAVQGLGNVGLNLARLLNEAGAELTVSDVRPEVVAQAVRAFGATAVDVDAISGIEADVFAPCALGAVINDETLPRLKVAVVAGAANNQLATPAHGAALRDRGILYAPDYVINAGGIIRVGAEITGGTRADVDARVRGIGDTLLAVFQAADAEGIPTSEAADRMALERIVLAQKAGAVAA